MSSESPSVDRATELCTYCPKMCRCSCPAAEAEHRETVTPWGMMRLYEFVKDGTVPPDPETAEAFWHCMGCRRCQEWCLHDNDVPEAMWRARREMANRGVMPEALEGFVDDFCENGVPHDELPSLDGASESEGAAVDDVFDDGADIVYVPDCETRAQRPADVLRAGLLWHELLGEPVRLHEQTADNYQCCGFPLGAAGDRQGWAAQWKEVKQHWDDADRVICECPAMVAQVRHGTSFGPDSEGGLPASAVDDPGESAVRLEHAIEVLDEVVEDRPPEHPVSADDWMLHDACFTTRQLELAEATRRVLDVLCDPPPEEFHVSGEEAPCCGGPSHYHVVAPEASERLARDRLEQMARESGESVVCGAATCRKAFARSDESAVAGDILEIACAAYDVGTEWPSARHVASSGD